LIFVAGLVLVGVGVIGAVVGFFATWQGLLPPAGAHENFIGVWCGLLVAAVGIVLCMFAIGMSFGQRRQLARRNEEGDKTCRACGHGNEAGAKFCNKCGAAMVG
jgi:ABC-type Mn2+/Zn2+ transport system permease subunit